MNNVLNFPKVVLNVVSSGYRQEIDIHLRIWITENSNELNSQNIDYQFNKTNINIFALFPPQ